MVARPISGDTGSDAAMSWALDCFRTCVESHKSCRPGLNPLPTRVLDLCPGGSPFSKEHIVLYETQRELNAYACLSYCWGDTLHLRTTKFNRESLKQGISWDSMPLTFQHAILTARQFDIRYLWIDSLCIIQDDEDDKKREIDRMRSIYAGSIITLAAAKSDNPDGGFYAMAPEEFADHRLDTRQIREKGWTIYIREWFLHHDLTDYEIRQTQVSPLGRRGWRFKSAC
jgi:hypothetical protein